MLKDKSLLGEKDRRLTGERKAQAPNNRPSERRAAQKQLAPANTCASLTLIVRVAHATPKLILFTLNGHLSLLDFINPAIYWHMWLINHQGKAADPQTPSIYAPPSGSDCIPH